ncbi:hypothetical protein [Halobacteriovorax sp. HLS]|uniref:hypothetical protein n=1 Tax=Halobacteriovorax sp. HLS TaxID=2234000 RepID=UPI000FD948DA|nr:hypothetical protein [Halobacteriovorax sp. HLS]
MRKLLLLILLISSISTLAYDGGYECSSNNKLHFNKQAQRLIDAKDYLIKVEEMIENGNIGQIDKQLDQADQLLTQIQLEFKSSNYCHSLSKNMEYMTLNISKYQLQSKIFRSKFNATDSCQFSIELIKKKLEDTRSPASSGSSISYLNLSKSLNKTNLLLASNECNSNQKSELFALFDSQSNLLEEIYESMK